MVLWDRHAFIRTVLRARRSTDAMLVHSVARLTRASAGSSDWRVVAALDKRPLYSFQRFLRAISQRYARVKEGLLNASMLPLTWLSESV